MMQLNELPYWSRIFLLKTVIQGIFKGKEDNCINTPQSG